MTLALERFHKPAKQNRHEKTKLTLPNQIISSVFTYDIDLITKVTLALEHFHNPSKQNRHEKTKVTLASEGFHNPAKQNRHEKTNVTLPGKIFSSVFTYNIDL